MRAHQGRFDLPLHTIRDNGIVTKKVDCPGLFCNDAVATSATLHWGCLWLVLDGVLRENGLENNDSEYLDAVEVLMEAVEKKVEKLLRILLLVPSKARLELADDVLQFSGGYDTRITKPGRRPHERTPWGDGCMPHTNSP